MVVSNCCFSRVDAELVARVDGLRLAVGGEVRERGRLDSQELGVLLQVPLRCVLWRVRLHDGRRFGRQPANDSLLVRVDVGLRVGS